jgi:addiction module HigA family antidote
MNTKKIPPVHPGKILQIEFLEPLGISQNRLARTMRVPPDRINAIVQCKRSITADTAIRLALALNTDPEFWLNIQTRFDLETARDEIESLAKKEVIPLVV